MPPGAFPPPPPYQAYNTAYPHPYGNPYPPAYGNQPATNGMAIGSLVSSLVGIPAYFLCLPFVGSIIGVVLGIIALNQIGKCHQKGKEMAIAGIAIGGVTLLGSLLLLMVYSSKLFLY
jgi:CBS-domain-containing membrane protein